MSTPSPEELNLVRVDSESGVLPGPVTTGEGNFQSSLDWRTELIPEGTENLPLE